MARPTPFKLASHNMRGFKTSCNLVKELVDENVIVALQEHWLRPDNLSNLSMISNNIAYYGVSGMTEKTCSGLVSGRPFGGVAFVWNRDYSKYVKALGSNASGRCCAITVTLGTRSVIIINVYFPCAEVSTAYQNEVSECLGFIDHTLSSNSYDDVVIIGDTNFPCHTVTSGYTLLSKLLNNYKMSHCDDLLVSATGTGYTYVNEALGHRSCLDHIFVTSELRQYIQNYDILLMANNFSDHRPISITFNLNVSADDCVSASGSRYALRWDKCDLHAYYEATRVYLSDIKLDSSYANCDDTHCSDEEHYKAISEHYDQICAALGSASDQTVPKIRRSSLRPFWNEELDDLKSTSIFWHRMWQDAGSPSSGWLFKVKNSCKYKYKLAIRHAFREYETAHTDELNEHFLQKNIPDFWKVWNKKFNKSLQNTPRIHGLDDNEQIAEEFSSYFAQIYNGLPSATNSKCDHDVIATDLRNDFDKSLIDYELVDKCLHNLKLGKASGPDELMAEHLVNAHPSLIFHLCVLFRQMSVHSYVPDAFGYGLIIPLVKDKSGDINSVSNYRGITLTPIISKLFECVLLTNCEHYLITDDLQFGFKSAVGCPQAVFTLRMVIEYFNSRGSTVYAAALDISKAFDTVCHSQLFRSLIKAGIPTWIVLLIINWYGKLMVAVRWVDKISNFFHVISGVRQGGILSPVLFTVFINLIIVRLKDCGFGCVINGIYIGCIMYADDIILLSATVDGLQKMCDVCVKAAADLKLTFNCNKSVCIAFGPMFHAQVSDMSLGMSKITWQSSVKYLGLTLISGPCFKVDIDIIKRKFFASCNAVLNNSVYQLDLVRLQLSESYCMPVLQYCLGAITLSNSQLMELNACWNMVYRRIFGFHRWESVKLFICGLGRLDFKHIYVWSSIKLAKKMSVCNNYVLQKLCVLYGYSSQLNALLYDYCISLCMSFSMVKSIVFNHFHDVCYV